MDIIATYISLLSQFFSLSDIAVASNEAGMTEPKFIPPGTNSLSTSLYLSRILQEITECINDLSASDISNDAATSLKEFMDSARWKFEDVLGYTWIRGSPFNFYLTGSRRLIIFLRCPLIPLSGKLGTRSSNSFNNTLSHEGTNIPAT